MSEAYIKGIKDGTHLDFFINVWNEDMLRYGFQTAVLIGLYHAQELDNEDGTFNYVSRNIYYRIRKLVINQKKRINNQRIILTEKKFQKFLRYSSNPKPLAGCNNLKLVCTFAFFYWIGELTHGSTFNGDFLKKEISIDKGVFEFAGISEKFHRGEIIKLRDTNKKRIDKPALSQRSANDFLKKLHDWKLLFMSHKRLSKIIDGKEVWYCWTYINSESNHVNPPVRLNKNEWNPYEPLSKKGRKKEIQLTKGPLENLMTLDSPEINNPDTIKTGDSILVNPEKKELITYTELCKAKEEATRLYDIFEKSKGSTKNDKDNEDFSKVFKLYQEMKELYDKQPTKKEKKTENMFE